MAIADPPEPDATKYPAGVNKALKRAVEFLVASAVLGAVAACDIPEPDHAEREAWEANQANAAAAAADEPEVAPEPLSADPPGTRWETGASGEGASLILVTRSGERRLVLFCRPRSGVVLVNVPRFHPLRDPLPLRLSSGGTALDLTSGVQADPRRGGVSVLTQLTPDLGALFTRLEPITVSYGAWQSGPHGAIMPEIARGFVSACSPASG